MKIITKTDIVEDFHGTKVADPFRLLEDSDSAETLAWTTKQNERTKEYLNGYVDRKKINENIAKRIDHPIYSLPQLVGDYYYFHHNSGLQNQPIFYRSKSLDPHEKEMIIEPNRFNGEGTTALTNTTFSRDGKLLAYVLSYNGSDQREVKVRNLDTGSDYPETLALRRHCIIAWGPDNDGFYYSDYPKLNNNKQEDPAYYNRVYWHTVGTDQSEDILVFEDPKQKELSYEPYISTNNNYLLLKAFSPTEPKSDIYYRPLNSTNDSFTKLIGHRNNNFTFITNHGDAFYFLTNDDAPKSRVISININNPDPSQWKEVISESEDTLLSVAKIGDYFVATVLDDVNGRVKIYNADGTLEIKVPLTGHISITGVTASKTKDEILIGYSSFLQPEQIMAYHIEKNELTPVFPQHSPVDQADYSTKQITYTSKDGTQVPMYLVHKNGLKLTGNNPTLLYAYGGYNLNITPTYSARVMTWLDAGGVYAVPSLRGGGEFGRYWHEAGTFERKQNVFDDFYHAAEWLIDNGYTNPKKLAIMGSSNGGLLVGASITQRPDLFGAALCLVPVTDMLRFQKFTFGRFWVTEFGNAEERANDFKNMYKYSPLHNLKEGVEYPPTLIATANHDDRVVPAHARKFAASLQEIQSSSNSILFKEEKNAGHGEGKPISKIIEAETDLLTFLWKVLEV